MKNTGGNKNGDIEIVYAMIQEKAQELEEGQKAGDATIVEGANREDGINKYMDPNNELMEMSIQSHYCGFDPDTGLAVRVINGQKILVDKELMKEYRDERIRTGKPVIKGFELNKSENNKNDENIR